MRARLTVLHCIAGSIVQGELGSKDDTVKELRRWLDQAQGQLQNTQTALHEREAECKTLSGDLDAALADLKALKVHPARHTTHLTHICTLARPMCHCSAAQLQFLSLCTELPWDHEEVECPDCTCVTTHCQLLVTGEHVSALAQLDEVLTLAGQPGTLSCCNVKDMLRVTAVALHLHHYLTLQYLTFTGKGHKQAKQ